jgi:Phage integrase family
MISTGVPARCSFVPRPDSAQGYRSRRTLARPSLHICAMAQVPAQSAWREPKPAASISSRCRPRPAPRSPPIYGTSDRQLWTGPCSFAMSHLSTYPSAKAWCGERFSRHTNDAAGPGRGFHILRHSVASRLLRAGTPMKEIADILRHRSLDTSAIYTKVDLTRLALVALPWPGSAS